MVIFQVALLALGVVGGLLLALRLRRQPWSTISQLVVLESKMVAILVPSSLVEYSRTQ